MSAVEKATTGPSSSHGPQHVRGSAGSWGAVTLLLLASVFFGFAIPATSWALAIVGMVLGVAGVGLAKVAHLMEQFY